MRKRYIGFSGVYINQCTVLYSSIPGISFDFRDKLTMPRPHKKAAQLLKNWELSGEIITDICCRGTGINPARQPGKYKPAGAMVQWGGQPSFG